jgi:peptidyl-prolyl cis-trans isomerase B (cyclophilin B)
MSRFFSAMSPSPLFLSRFLMCVALSAVLGLGIVMEMGTTAQARDWNPVNFFAGGPEASKSEKTKTESNTARKGKSSESLSTPEEKAAYRKRQAERLKAEGGAPELERAAPDKNEGYFKFWGRGEDGKSSSAGEKTEAIVGEHQGALIYTEKGNIAIEFFPEQAPVTVKNFVTLVDKKFYDQPNMTFHRVVPGFVIQTGDPTGTGAGGSKDRIPLEAKNKLSHNAKGVVAMARNADPNSASSQFYITLAPQTSLDGKYAIFGKVVSGLDVLDQIKQGDKLYGVSMVDLTTVQADPVEKKSFGTSLKGVKNAFAKKN